MTRPAAAPVSLTDTTLRDGNESVLGGRLRASEIVPLAAKLDHAGFAALEVFGGAAFEAMLNAGDDPWSCLRQLREVISATPIQALVRGQSLLGPRHLADDAVELFVRTAAGLGVDVFRLFDPLNDLRNLEVAARAARAAGKRVQIALCYGAGPESEPERWRALGDALAELEPDDLVIKDSAGLLDPPTAAQLVDALRSTGLPVLLHTHCTSGLATLACLAAVRAGVAGLDTTVASLAWGPSLPAAETVAAALAGEGHATGLDLDRLVEVEREVEELRRRHQADGTAPGGGQGAEALHRGLPARFLTDVRCRLAEHGATARLEEAIADVRTVRRELGNPPLVTPVRQMIAQQVVYNVLGGERYATVSQELKDYLHGLYGRPPDPADKGLRRWVLGGDEAITVRAADLLDPQVDQARNELRRRGLPHEDVHALTHLMFPALTAVVFGPKADEPLIPPTGGTPGGEPDPEEMIAPAAGGSGNQALAPEPASASTLQATEFEVEVEGEIFRVRVTGAGGVGVVPVAAGAAPVGTPAAPPSRQGAVVAPMQGLVVKIPVAVGEQVNLGDVLIVLEAMKMHNDIVATQPGKVTRIHVKEGEVVKPDQPLLTIG